jgi:hypothetical protein
MSSTTNQYRHNPIPPSRDGGIRGVRRSRTPIPISTASIWMAWHVKQYPRLQRSASQLPRWGKGEWNWEQEGTAHCPASTVFAGEEMRQRPEQWSIHGAVEQPEHRFHIYSHRIQRIISLFLENCCSTAPWISLHSFLSFIIQLMTIIEILVDINKRNQLNYHGAANGSVAAPWLLHCSMAVPLHVLRSRKC